MNSKISKIKFIYSFIYQLATNKNSNHSIFKSIINFPKCFNFYFMKGEILDKKLPWFNIEIFSLLEQQIRNDMNLFEFGSGGSTLYFASRVKEVISVEHDEEWYNNLTNVLDSQKISNVKLNLCSLSTSLYMSSISNFPDEYFDLIFIDGRNRNKCLEYSFKKLKLYGLLIFDNSDRKKYNESIEFLKNRGTIYRNYGPTIMDVNFSETLLFVKRKYDYEKEELI